MSNKNEISIKSTMFCCRIVAVAALVTFAAAGTAFAETITKSFEFGAGAAQTRSQFRTFTVPCGTRMVTSVTYSRSGDAGVNNDVPIFIEVRKPGATAEEDGPRAEAKENIKATRVPKTASFAGSTTNLGGCSIPWRVRVRHDADGPAPNLVSGNITVSFATPTSSISVGSFGLNKSTAVTKNFGDSNGLNQGTVEITANWVHTILGAQGPNPIKLKWELIDPNGTVVKAFAAFSSNEARSSLTRFRLTHQLADCVPGQWKIRITNNEGDDAVVSAPTVQFKPDCP